jgi:hypothetical protein
MMKVLCSSFYAAFGFFAMILSSGQGFKFCGSFRFSSSSSLDSHMYVCMYTVVVRRGRDWNVCIRDPEFVL